MVRRSFLCILLLAAMMPIAAVAQMIRGTATDATTGMPIKAAEITLFTAAGQRVGRVRSDDDGKFEMVIPKGKTVYLQASRIGYETLKSAPITATTQELLELSVSLSAAAIPLEGVKVVARRQVDPRLREFVDRASLYKRSGIGHIWTRKELESRPLALTSQLLNWVHTRPASDCAGMSVFVDNMPIDAEDMDLLVAPEDLEGVEIYNDTDVPPDLLYKSRMTIGRLGETMPPCRTVMLWRKPYAELNAYYASHRFKPWQAVLGAVLLAGVILLEQAVWKR